MAICPGLCGDLALTPFRVFLGTLPAPAIEERFLRQLQPVYAWYLSRKRIKEQANEFIEIDLASCDLEILMRYTHVYYVRRQLFDEALDKQFGLLESGKTPKMADPALLQCLFTCNTSIAPRLQYELHQLQAAKKSARVPGRRELSPDAPLDIYDYTCMMRLVEEDVCGIEDAEMKARSYLPRDHAEAKLRHLIQLLMGADAKPSLDKKETKLLERMIPPDYTRVGCVKKLRPCDLTSYFRFYGERVCKVAPENYFKRAMWGHVCRKFATNPYYLRGSSIYWARHSGLHSTAHFTTMPPELASAVCNQQTLFPAIKFRSQYLYSSPELARQLWRADAVVPLMRLFPLLGANAAEDLAAGVLVDAFWSRLPLGNEENPLHDSLIRTVRQFVDDMGNLYESNMDAVLKRVEEGIKVVVPHLTPEELRATALGLSGEKEQTTGEEATI